MGGISVSPTPALQFQLLLISATLFFKKKEKQIKLEKVWYYVPTWCRCRLLLHSSLSFSSTCKWVFMCVGIFAGPKRACGDPVWMSFHLLLPE